MNLRLADDLRGVWAISWRSVAYLPWMVATSLFWFGIVTGLISVPVLAVIDLAFGFWWDAFWKLTLWTALWLTFLFRSFRGGRTARKDACLDVSLP